MARFGLTVREASEETEYNSEYLMRLIRQSKIEAELIGQVCQISRFSSPYLRVGDEKQGGPQPACCAICRYVL
jgi:hypothetical protein